MTELRIRVFGRVDLLVDGQPLQIARQEATVLATLVAAAGPVRRDQLVDAVWSDADAPRGDGLSPVVARLRKRLAVGKVDIAFARDRRTYELVGPLGTGAESLVDAVRFGHHAAEGDRLAAQGRDLDARDAYLAATAEWTDVPFALFGDDLPEPCLRLALTLRRRRADLVTHLGEVGLRLGRYDVPGDHPIVAGADDADALWMVRFLTVLREAGGPAAEGLIDARRAVRGYDDVATRAFDLLSLHEFGFDVHRPLRIEPRPTERGTPARLVGRDAELAALDVVLNAVTAGRPAALTVSGVGGVGKTRLLEEAGRLADRRGAAAVSVTCYPSGELQPWRLLAGALWARTRRDPSTGPSPLDRGTLVDFLSAMAGGERHPRQLTSALSALLRSAARPRGLIVAFDNADLLAPRALELLDDVRDALGDAGVGFILSGRDEGAWQEWPGDDRRGALTTLRLGVLGADGVREWLADALGREPTEDEALNAYRATGGLPIRLGDLAPSAPDDTPRVTRRIGQLSEWLAAAAITGLDEEIDTGLVAEMLGLDPDEADRHQAAAVESRAIEGHGPVRFRHALWREEVLTELEQHPALARRLHRRAFEVLDARIKSARVLDQVLSVRIAHHARAAAVELTDEQVAIACLAAAQAEQRSFAPKAAMVWAEEGLRRRCAPKTRFALLVTLGDARNDTGYMDEAGRDYLAAYEVADEYPRLRAVAAVKMARRWSDPGRVDVQLTQILRTCLVELASEPTDDEVAALVGQLQAHLAHKTAMAVPDGRTGAELAHTALDTLSPGWDPAIQCEILTECRWGLYDTLPPSELATLAGRLYEAGLRAKSSHFRSEGLVALAIDRMRMGRIGDTLAAVEEFRQHVQFNRSPLNVWQLGVLETVLDLWRGRFDAAEARILGESLRTVQELESSQTLPASTLRQTWMGQMYWLRHEQGRMEELFGLGLADQMDQHGFFPIWQAGLVLAHAETGRHDRAADLLTAMVHETDDLRALPPHGWAAPTLGILAEACALLADSPAAGPELTAVGGTLHALLTRHLDEVLLAGWPTVLIGPAARFAGALALVAGRPDEALDQLGVAARLVSAAAPQLARVRLDRARAYLLRDGPGDRDDAAALLRKVLTAADALGMADVSARARALLGQVS
ncbi:AAA family ATPase [Cryptosporangium aurantiacum]|uniref:Transcriptional regulatory protein, C terminal n=1 Tax=Cryptosporangium aurantiacum TaxID=134849 RepID=A0A1M7RJ30_9ACTN|nr:AAA family ATPase [Cryptosporangium aurantiacum]SHN46274.1 Transcriptional regulatory protein, C terminal [Cryptosporangium aurantiacum]